jgi:hypothetical protein
MKAFFQLELETGIHNFASLDAIRKSVDITWSTKPQEKPELVPSEQVDHWELRRKQGEGYFVVGNITKIYLEMIHVGGVHL